MDKGIDGFRMDVITQISKVVDKNGRPFRAKRVP